MIGKIIGIIILLVIVVGIIIGYQNLTPSEKSVLDGSYYFSDENNVSTFPCFDKKIIKDIKLHNWKRFQCMMTSEHPREQWDVGDYNFAVKIFEERCNIRVPQEGTSHCELWYNEIQRAYSKLR
jgi:hypothetical protein